MAQSRGAAPGDHPHPRLPLQPDEDSRLLPLLVCLRVLFVPLFMLCHVPERSRLPILFPQDAYFITFMLLFAVSNGYLVSLTMCLAPRSGGWEGEGRAWERAGGLTLEEGQPPRVRLLSSPARAVSPGLTGAPSSGQALTDGLAPGQELRSRGLVWEVPT